MGIAYSPPNRVIHADMDASTSECLRTGLHAAVLRAGWEIDRAITNGYVYLLTSPQDPGLQMKVQIHDTDRGIWPPGRKALDIVFMSADEANRSYPYALTYGAGQRLRAHITPCQIFTFRAGSTLEYATAVMGGVPFIDPNALASGEHCSDEDNDIETTVAWWSCGDLSTSGYGQPASSFRAHWVGSCNAVQHNAVFSRGVQDGAENTTLRLVPPNKPTVFFYNYGASNFSYPLMMWWMGTEEPLCLDAFLAWNPQHPVKVRGQVWDAFIRTKHVPPEDPFVMDALPFFAYSSNQSEGFPSPHWYQTTDICTLYLRDPGVTVFTCEGEPPPPSELSNYVY